MSTRTQTRAKTPSAPKWSFTSARTGLLQRKLLLGGTSDLASEFTESCRQRLVSQPPLNRIKSLTGPISHLVQRQVEPDEEEEEKSREAAKVPTLSLSGVGSYSDNSASHEKITYTVNVPTGINVKKYCLVQWTKGYAKQGDGTYFKTTVYGTTRDWNDPNWVIDSVDKDPIYWSNSSARWNYNKTGNQFTATDDPGPALSSEKGAVYAAQFKVAVYKTAKVPTTTSGTISTTPVTSFKFWNYSVKVGSDGKFSHPRI